MARLIGLRSLAARGLLAPRPPLSLATAATAAAAWPTVRRSSFESPSPATDNAGSRERTIAQGKPRKVIKATIPSAIPGVGREIHYHPDDVVRLASKYRRLRDITDFDRLLPKFLAQKRFEKQQVARAQSSSARHLRKMGGEAVKQREFAISGKRGIPDVRACLGEDWNSPEEVPGPLHPRRPWPPAAFAGVGRKWVRGRRPLQVLKAPPLETSPRIPLTVRLTTHHGAQGSRKGTLSTTVSAPPMDSSLHPGLPLAFLPTTPAIQALERPLLKLHATPRLEGGAPEPLDTDAQALRIRRRREASPAYVARVRELLAAQTCPRVAELGKSHLRKALEKLEPKIAVRRKSSQPVVSEHESRGEPVLSIGLFVRTGIKATHAVAAVRFAVKGKARRALVEALKRDFAAHGGAAAGAQDRWQHWVFYIDPNPMVKLIPLTRLVDLMAGALQVLDARRTRQPAIGSESSAQPRIRPLGRSEQRPQLTRRQMSPALPQPLGKKALVEAERLGISPEEYSRRRAIELEEKAQRVARKTAELEQRTEANRLRRLAGQRRSRADDVDRPEQSAESNGAVEHLVGAHAPWASSSQSTTPPARPQQPRPLMISLPGKKSSLPSGEGRLEGEKEDERAVALQSQDGTPWAGPGSGRPP